MAVYICAYAGAQMWTIGVDARLRAQNICIVPIGGSAPCGTQAGTTACSATDARQRWTVEVRNALRNSASRSLPECPSGKQRTLPARA
jgi:hypothetical protein